MLKHAGFSRGGYARFRLVNSSLFSRANPRGIPPFDQTANGGF